MIFDFTREPILQFQGLLQNAEKQGIRDPNAMALATTDFQGRPFVRVVLFKGVHEGGFLFFTNYNSRKAQHIDKCPYVAATFFWADLAQQISVIGRVEKTSRQVSEDYFRSRPRLSQLGAWASAQSQKVEDLDVLNLKLKEFEKKYEGQDIPCPPHWGGFRIIPQSMEFWFGKEGRLHERYVYTRVEGDSNWSRSYLSP